MNTNTLCVECGDAATHLLACGFAVCELCRDWHTYSAECPPCDGYNAQCNFAFDSPSRQQYIARMAVSEGRPAGESQIVLHCTFWVPGPGLCNWTGPASEAGWCTHYQEWICPNCGASDGLHIVQDKTTSQPAPDAHLEETYELQFEMV
jgi:hypothetical protein